MQNRAIVLKKYIYLILRWLITNAQGVTMRQIGGLV